MATKAAIRSHLWTILLLHLADIFTHRCSVASQESLSCQSCVFYANLDMPINNPLCASGRNVSSKPCAAKQACQVTFLQDSNGSIVHAARRCQQPIVPGRADISVVFNAKTTMYCDSSGCNNNWLGQPSRGAASGGPHPHCWVGYGKRIDDFQLLPCSDRVAQLVQASAAAAGNSTGQRLIAVCLLAQLTRQITYRGRRFESTLYLADCAPHATGVYGRNYPMFEYERVCTTSGCNAGAAAAKFQDGVMLRMSASTVGGFASATRAAAVISAASAACCWLVGRYAATLFLW